MYDDITITRREVVEEDARFIEVETPNGIGVTIAIERSPYGFSGDVGLGKSDGRECVGFWVPGSAYKKDLETAERDAIRQLQVCSRELRALARELDRNARTMKKQIQKRKEA